jgi:hypothetical protein
MPRRNWLRRASRTAGQILLAAAATDVAHAQTAVDPQTIEFIPSSSNSATLADGSSAVTRYDVEIAVAGTTQVLQRVTLGKPAPDPDGMIRANFVKDLITTPVAGTSYDARILTVGPLGTTGSTRSNAFTFSACQYSLSSTGASVPAAGASGSVVMTTSGGWCGWTAGSSASWLTVDSATSTLGSSTVAFTAAANTTGSSRSASLTLGPLTFTVSQAGAAAQTIDVSTEAQLQSAVATLASNTTIRLAPGSYKLTTTLNVTGMLNGVVIKGSTGRASDVVIEGQGMSTNGTAATALNVTGAVQGLQIADLTIQNVYRSAVLFDNGPQAPRISNVRLVNCGDACVATGLTGGGVHDGLVETSWIGYTTTGASTRAGGIDLRGSQRWTIRGNAFQNVRGPSNTLSRPAVAASSGSSDTQVERNAFLNVSTAVSLGLADQAGAYDHARGRVANNRIYRSASIAGGPGISVIDSPSTTVVHNTVVQSGTYASPIEYRFAGASGLVIANNLLDGPATARDGAAAALTGNVTNAAAGWFVDAPAGELHLRPSATSAIDLADVSVTEAVDDDGDPRPMGAGPDVGADEVNLTNAVPTVQVVAPVSGSYVKLSATVQIQAQAADTDGSVAWVDFYVNDVYVGTATAGPYVVSWKTAVAGTYSVVAVAVDNAGGRAASQAVTIIANKKGR